MAEIEHFCDPLHKDHPKFSSVKDLEIILYSACNQMDGELPQKKKIGDAVSKVIFGISMQHLNISHNYRSSWIVFI